MSDVEGMIYRLQYLMREFDMNASQERLITEACNTLREAGYARHTAERERDTARAELDAYKEAMRAERETRRLIAKYRTYGHE